MKVALASYILKLSQSLLSMNQNKLLTRQVAKILPEIMFQQPEIQQLLAVINDSYNAYERDIELSERAFRISEEEYIDINEKLANEVLVRKQSVEKLKETIGVITGKETKNNSEDLMVIARYLNQQVNKRKRAEQELKSSQELWQFALEGSGDGVWQYDFKTQAVFFSKQYKKMLGYEENEFKNEINEWTGRIHPEDRDKVEKINRLYFENEIADHQREYRIRHKEGHYLWILDRNILINHTSDGGAKRIIGTHTDITERKKAADDYKLISVVASTNKNGVVFTDTAGVITWSNEGFCNLSGYPMDEIIGRTPLELCMGRLSKGPELSLMVKSFFEGINFDTEVIFFRKDGSNFWGRTKGQALLDENGKVKNYFAIIEDISQKRQQEEQLQILSSIAEENMQAVIISDKEGKIEWVNKSFEKISGYSLDEMMGKKPGAVLQGPETNTEVVAYMKKQINLGEPFTCEILNYHKSGRKYWLRIQGQALRDKQGNIFKYFAIEEDISVQKETSFKIKEIESHFRLALEKLGDNVWEHDFKTNTTTFSNTANNFLGFNITEFTDNEKLWWENVYEEDLPLLVENDRKYKSKEIDYHVLEYRMRHKDGRIKWVLDRGVVLEKDGDGNPLKIIGTHADVTMQKDAEQALKFKEEKYRSIIANMNLGLMEVDNEEQIQFINQSFSQMSGYSQEELLGKKASDVFTLPQHLELVQMKEALREKGISDAYEISVINKAGEQKWWLISGGPLFNDKGVKMGSIGIHLDITEQKMLEYELLASRQHAESSANAKQTFLANMSHEIRTPMNAILGMSRQLQKTSLNEQQALYLNTINNAGGHLMVIINDILDISKIEAGKLALEKIGFSIREVIKNTVEVMQHRASEKGLLINYFAAENIAGVLCGDPFRLKQILFNLVSNAVKFSDEGSINIHFTLQQQYKDSQLIQIAVSDNGIGMDKEFINSVFQSFTQEDKSVSRKFGGTGLGMNITRQLAELMGGSIQVESEKNVGTTITLAIPFVIGKESDLPPKEIVITDNAILKGKKILLVEDNEINRLVATITLNQYGADISTAVNGIEAVEAARNEEIDLILMDMQMPVMDGLEATKIIRRDLNTGVPIIALTANAIKGESEKCYAAGMNDFISKPFDEEKLIAMIAKWLGKEAVVIVLEKTPAPPVETLFDLTKIYQLSRGNKEFVKEMITLFIEEVNEALEKINTAYTLNDFPVISFEAHRLISTIGNLGITSLEIDIREIEIIAKEGISTDTLQPLITKLNNTLVEVMRELEIVNLESL